MRQIHGAFEAQQGTSVAEQRERREGTVDVGQRGRQGQKI